MGKKWFSRLVLLVTAVCILLPAALLLVWSVTGRWPWPRLTPETYTLRTLRELLFGSTSLLQLLGSSVALAGPRRSSAPQWRSLPPGPRSSTGFPGGLWPGSAAYCPC